MLVPAGLCQYTAFSGSMSFQLGYPLPRHPRCNLLWGLYGRGIRKPTQFSLRVKGVGFRVLRVLWVQGAKAFGSQEAPSEPSMDSPSSAGEGKLGRRVG